MLRHVQEEEVLLAERVDRRVEREHDERDPRPEARPLPAGDRPPLARQRPRPAQVEHRDDHRRHHLQRPEVPDHGGERSGARHDEPQVGLGLPEQREDRREDDRQRLPGRAAGRLQVDVHDLAPPDEPRPRVIAGRGGDQQRGDADDQRHHDQSGVEAPRRSPVPGASHPRIPAHARREPSAGGNSVAEAESMLASGRRGTVWGADGPVARRDLA